MNFDTAVQAIRANITAGDMTPIILLGPPGCGKTTVCVDVNEQLGIPRHVTERIIFRPSLRDPVDLVGLPHTERDDNGDLYTYWSGNSLIREVNDIAEKYGPVVFPIDEVAQAVPMMQNALSGLLLDRFVGNNVLHPNVFMVATGNRVSDKAGSGRLLTQLANRCEVLEVEPDLTSWSNYMIAKDYDPMIVAYCRFDPAAIDDFDPNRTVNGTMRSWEAAAKVDTNLPRDLYISKLSGRVPEGRVASYMAFRDLFDELPSADEMCKSPMTAKVPVTNRGALFAAASLAYKRATPETFSNLCKYVGRIATEALAMDIEAFFYKDVMLNKSELTESPDFIQWASTRGAEVLL